MPKTQYNKSNIYLRTSVNLKLCSIKKETIAIKWTFVSGLSSIVIELQDEKNP